MAVKNEASADTTVTLRAEAPAGFTTTFKEGYNTQEITSPTQMTKPNRHTT